MDYVSSAIRVDNLQDVAILEYRSARTGEVLQQYPTQSQIDAFKRAERLLERRAQVSHHAPVHVAAPQPAAAEGGAGRVSSAAPASPSSGSAGQGSTHSVLA